MARFAARLALCTLGALLWGPGPAEAQTVPRAFNDRPLTVPEGTLRVDASGGLDQDQSIFLRMGAALGFSDDAELGVSGALPIDEPEEAEPTAEGATVYFRYRYLAKPWRESFTEGAVELNGHIDPAGKQGTVGVSMPVRVSPGPFRFDTGAEAQLTVSKKPLLASALSLRRLPSQDHGSAGFPAAASVNATPWLFVGVRSGAGVRDILEWASTFFVPLGFWAGASVGQGRFVADFAASFDFYDFWQPRRGSTNTDAWIATATLSFYVDAY